jgi:hypothetical protein
LQIPNNVRKGRCPGTAILTEAEFEHSVGVTDGASKVSRTLVVLIPGIVATVAAKDAVRRAGYTGFKDDRIDSHSSVWSRSCVLNS